MDIIAFSFKHLIYYSIHLKVSFSYNFKKYVLNSMQFEQVQESLKFYSNCFFTE